MCQRCTAQHTPHNSTAMLLVHIRKIYDQVRQGRPAYKVGSYPQRHGWPYHCKMLACASHGASQAYLHHAPTLGRTVRQSPVLQRWCHPPQCLEWLHPTVWWSTRHTNQKLSAQDNPRMPTESERHTPYISTDMLLVHLENIRCGRTAARPAQTFSSYPHQQGQPCLLSLQSAHMCFTRSQQGVSSLCPTPCCSTRLTSNTCGDMDKDVQRGRTQIASNIRASHTLGCIV
jgi:hypothetical protein